MQGGFGQWYQETTIQPSMQDAAKGEDLQQLGDGMVKTPSGFVLFGQNTSGLP